MVKDAYRFAIPPMFLGIVCAGLRVVLGGGGSDFSGVVRFLFLSQPGAHHSVRSGRGGVARRRARGGNRGRDFRFGRMGHRISIFLAVWDVHVQRAPLRGAHHAGGLPPGKFYAAMRGRGFGEERAERHLYGNAKRPLVFKQIAGAIARRVICWKREGEMAARRRARGHDSIRLSRGYLAADGNAGRRDARAKSERRRKRPGEMEFNDLDPIGHEEVLAVAVSQAPASPRHSHPSRDFHRRKSSVRLLRRAGHFGGRAVRSGQCRARDRDRYSVRFARWPRGARHGHQQRIRQAV